MQTVRYAPAHGSAEPIQCAGVELVPGQDVVVSDEDAALLLRSIFIVDAKTGKNPNFVCIDCKADVNHDGIFDVVRSRTHNNPIRSLVQEDGRRKCASCAAAPLQPVPPVSRYTPPIEMHAD